MKKASYVITGSCLIGIGAAVANGFAMAADPLNQPPFDQAFVVAASFLSTGPSVIIAQDTITGNIIIAPPFKSVNIEVVRKG